MLMCAFVWRRRQTENFAAVKNRKKQLKSQEYYSERTTKRVYEKRQKFSILNRLYDEAGEIESRLSWWQLFNIFNTGSDVLFALARCMPDFANRNRCHFDRAKNSQQEICTYVRSTHTLCNDNNVYIIIYILL